MGAFSEIYKLAKEEKNGGNKDKYEAYMICLSIMEEEAMDRARFVKQLEQERLDSSLALANAIVAAYENFKREEY
jgi:hypothetical protein